MAGVERIVIKTWWMPAAWDVIRAGLKMHFSSTTVFTTLDSVLASFIEQLRQM